MIQLLLEAKYDVFMICWLHLVLGPIAESSTRITPDEPQTRASTLLKRTPQARQQQHMLFWKTTVFYN
jgi:hypothetical protein